MWPLFHSRGLPQEDGLDAYVNFQSQFDAYIKTNKMFADLIEENYQKGDVWCHDYHLMFLPRLLKEKRPNMRVGWFLHTPFPSSETFHTYDYARNFVSVCTHILGLQGTLVGVQDQGRVTRIAAIYLLINIICLLLSLLNYLWLLSFIFLQTSVSY
ncbi:putative alpha,alpha-trehalose-phosphate synthase (UDP-forming) [Helianthus annuus]|nr:putative alpha,alpha-trehalose-phosphate synthase (UDP-forming) [Helianthus annuus]KAJ0564349.1 putative alpha,alpha-trehalose-phosphate synthase (UDP-forming) [Helianthus annuus]KAJ0729678.1 putative alpha,alpha-trehalose-phosphate synthase (UDP-forming) [Helianthus annuus]KAJ0732414.1 putative alpha,alpha-trehalose-phosphate synthase (UDP-forming) [Helianthus annuus]KAJ0906046.1 putative alpha,alpha-trehalose-phosphate synthase (UDP-forming) [Helianthus annuus]